MKKFLALFLLLCVLALATAAQAVDWAEAEELGLSIPSPADGEVLYIGEAQSDQAEKVYAAFAMTPGTDALCRLSILIYKVSIESPEVKISGMTVKINSDNSYEIQNGTVNMGAAVFSNWEFTKGGAEADFSYTLSLPQPAGFTYPLDEMHFVFTRDGEEEPEPETGGGLASHTGGADTLKKPAAETAADRPSVAETPDSLMLDFLLGMAEKDTRFWKESYDGHSWKEKWAFALFTEDGVQFENSFQAASFGEDFHGISAEHLAESLDEAATLILAKDNTSTFGDKTYNNANVYVIEWPSRYLLEQSTTDADFMPPSWSDEDPAVYYVESLAEFGLEARGLAAAGTDDSAEAEPYPAEEDGAEDIYNEAMVLYKEEKYYSARQLFIESQFGDWEEMADKCVQKWPANGEIWRDRSQWLQDMDLTININQPEDTAMYIRLYKNNALVSALFVGGPGKITAHLPGNGYYTIKDGVGTDWYGMKEVFGREGSYETMTFDESGTEEVYLQSYYEYTISINVKDSTGTGIGSENEDWEGFIED